MRKIAIIYTILPRLGGSSGVCLSLSKLLLEANVKIEVWTIEPPGEATNKVLEAELERMGVHVVNAPGWMRGRISLLQQAFFLLRGILAVKRADILIVIGMNRASAPICWSVRARRSLYYYINHDPLTATFRRLPRLANVFTWVVLNAGNTLPELKRAGHGNVLGNFTTIPQLSEFPYEGPASAAGVSRSTMKVVFMGALIETKGIREIAEAWATEAPEGCSLHIFGDGLQRERIEQLCRAGDGRTPGGGEPRVEYHGRYRLADRDAALNRILKGADLFVLPSKGEGEGLPTVLLEALCAGVPVVATSYGGLASLSKGYYPDLPDGIRLCSTAGFMDAVRDLVGDIRSGRIDNSKIRSFYLAHFADEQVQGKWRQVLGTQAWAPRC